MGTRKVTPPSSEIIPIRPSSPVLIPSNPLPAHFSPLLEEDRGQCEGMEGEEEEGRGRGREEGGGGGRAGRGEREGEGGGGERRRGSVGLHPRTVHELYYVVAVFESQE